jgi:hypothetical protein
MYNKKVLGEAVKKLGSAKAPTKKQDTIYNPKKEEMILDLSPEEIEEYRKGGYIIEDISVPSLNYKKGGAYYDDSRDAWISADGKVGPNGPANYKKGGALLTKKVTCKKCGWTWDAADGGNDMTTCHKCGGQGLIHAKYGGLNKFIDGGEPCPEGFLWDAKLQDCVPINLEEKKIRDYNFRKYLADNNMTEEYWNKNYSDWSPKLTEIPEVTVTSKLSKEGQRLYDKTYSGVQKYSDRVSDWSNKSIAQADALAIRNNIGTNDPFTGQYVDANNNTAYEQNASDIQYAKNVQDDFQKNTAPKIRVIDRAVQNLDVTQKEKDKLYKTKNLKKIEAEYEKWKNAPEGDDRQPDNPAYWAPGQLKSEFSVDANGNGTWTPGYGARRQPASAANNYNDGPIDLVYPEVAFMGPAGGLTGLAVKGAQNIGARIGASTLGQAIKTGITTALPLGETVTAATAGAVTPLNLVGAAFAADAVVNQFPGAVSDIGKGEYRDALEKTLYGTLGLAGLGIGKTLVSGTKDLSKFLGTESGLLSNVDDVAINLESQIAKLKEQEVLAEESRKVLWGDYKAGNITAEEYTAGAKKLNPGLEGTNPRFELEKQLREHKVKQEIINIPQQSILQSEEQLGKNISDGGTNTKGVFELGDDHVARLSAHGYDDASLLVKYTDKIKSPRIAKTLQVKELNGKVYQVQEKVAGTPIASLTETELQNIPKEHIDNFWKDKAELDGLGLSIDISGGKSNILYDPKKGFQFIDLGIGESSANEIIAQTYKGLKLPGSPNISAISEPFEIAAKRINNLSRNNTNRIIKTNTTASTEPAYVQQEFAFPTEVPIVPKPTFTRLQLNPTVPKIEIPTPSAKLTNEQRIMEGMEQVRLANEQKALATQQANALKASAEVPKTYPIGNPDYYTQLLSMTKMPEANRKFYTSVVETVKRQGNVASESQKNMLDRIKTGNFNFSGSTGNINAGLSPELIVNTTGSKNVVGAKLSNFMTDWGLPIGSMFNSALDVGSPVGSLGSKFLSKISPLNFIPKYGEKIEGATMSIGDILASGVKNGKVSVPKSLFKQAKNIIKKSDDAVLTVKNNKTNADIYTVKIDPNVKGSKVNISSVPEKQGLLSRKKNASFKVTNKKNVPLTEIKLEDPGVIVYRKLPFSNRYAVVDKTKLIEGKAQWATTGASAQKFAESYGKGLLITGAGGALLWAAEPSEETKKEAQDKWVKDEQTKAYKNVVKQYETQVETEKKLKYEEHKANITKLITEAIEQGNSQEKIISDLHSTGISAEELIQIYIDNGVPKEEAEDYINTILRNDIFNRKKGGEVFKFNKK